jgi:carbamoyltransferase
MTQHDSESVIIALSENHDASVAVWGGTVELTALATERVTRVKHDSAGITRTIDYLLETLAISHDQVRLLVRCNDPVAVPPTALAARDRQLHQRFPHARWLTGANHHELHALAARQLNPSSDGAILVVDGMGSRLPGTRDSKSDSTLYECTTIFDARNISRLLSVGTTHNSYEWETEHIGLGRLYSYVSKHIFGSRYDAGKTMALAAYGNASAYKSFLTYNGQPKIPSISGCDLAILEPEPNSQSEYMEWADLAARTQQDIEDGMLAFAQLAAQLAPGHTLFVSGGVALNCPSNEVIRNSGLFAETLIHPAATDDGISLGGIVLGAQESGIAHQLPSFTDPFIGPPIMAQRDRLLAAASRTSCRITLSLADSLAVCVANELREGRLIALYCGRSEFGPRALGHRSLIASPSSTAVRDYINTHVKDRETFRPLAPAILQDRVADYFDVCMDFENPYMLLTARANAITRTLCPAVVHIDGTARVQTVTRGATEEPLSSILESLEAAGQPPIVLNTSLNRKGQPIVETPEEAFELFTSSPIEILYTPGLLLYKE